MPLTLDVMAYQAGNRAASNGPIDAVNGRLEALRRNALGSVGAEISGIACRDAYCM